MNGGGDVEMQADRFFRLVGFASRLAPACVVLIASAGCQERPTTVSGTVTLDGRPLAIASDSRGTVTFHPANGQGSLAIGLIDSTGHFDLATGGSRIVAPGTYDVSVSVIRLLPKVEDVEQGTELVTPAKYVTAHESGLQAEVAPATENQLSFNLDSRPDAVGAPTESSDVAELDDGQPIVETTDNK
jgi:hypothetical protein